MNAKLVQRPIAAAVAAAILLSACATNPDGSIKMDDRAKGALIGAAAGCALASAAGSDCVKGAVVGAAVGFLVGWYFESKKVADAKQVNAEYQKKKVAIPKKEITPVAFSSNVQRAEPNAQGEQEVQITSSTDLIGYGDKVPEVSQKYAIYDENNKLVEEKTEKLTAVDGAGRYQTTSKFKKPANAKGKNYTVKTTLLANNKTYKENSYKVSFEDSGRIIVALAN
ncbi:YMGG-like glycine zipper-containing protein [Denitratisoma oestradiolicum]|uniref:17 kDa surface antigen n=1 Tax=Denitratisoma oestradiolicum TaxID=311182 RepID=A0A6S6XX21_9PROT|nr:YMGG-like glycine zipper-containing protein [Denitratisoma oestradiolicum]TWO80859.1 hypothetical protein CBW56_06800 [Denitratisoma oestradiolicum]CAB1367389.1 17 kDa surface antigen [Denitratisoma oestradiolicum]